MRFLKSKQKVYTSDSAAINQSEDVGVEGKRYPIHALGRVIALHPSTMLLTFLLPLVFFIVGCIKIQPDLSCAVDDYQISSKVPVRKDALMINAVLDQWSAALTGENFMNMIRSTDHQRTIVQDTLELRAVIDLPALMEFAKMQNMDNKTRDRYGNFLTEEVFRVYRAVEQLITMQDGYEDVCFTNNLRDGVVSNVYPVCTPVASITQYIYPVWDVLEWNMNGTGSVYQLNYLPRLFSNPSYGWFFDNNFSTLNPVARQLRSQYTFGSSKGQSKRDYLRHMRKFLPRLIASVNRGEFVSLGFAHFYLGGGTSQNLLAQMACDSEYYKVGVAA
ncbi:subtilisin-like serine peptidase serine peptidase clan SB family S8-like protein, partial [Leptomonas seymouri]